MSLNSSSVATFSPIFPVDLSTYLLKCFSTDTGVFVVTAYTVTSILVLLPLCVLVLHLGRRRRRRRRPGTATSHSDLITFHMVAVELLGLVAITVTCLCLHADLPLSLFAGCFYLRIIATFAQVFLHTLTCVERYLAVVHPITYLSLREAKGIRVRNAAIGGLWLLSFAQSGLLAVENKDPSFVFYLCSTAAVLITVSFCSVSVLCALIRPGPGEGGGARPRVDQSKLRAFYTIMAVMGVLVLRFGMNIVVEVLYMFPQLERRSKCVLWICLSWINLPSCLVSPLLFLHRAGKLPCCSSRGPGSD